jgi:hypothetical protein
MTIPALYWSRYRRHHLKSYNNTNQFNKTAIEFKKTDLQNITIRKNIKNEIQENPVASSIKRTNPFAFIHGSNDLCKYAPLHIYGLPCFKMKSSMQKSVTYNNENNRCQIINWSGTVCPAERKYATEYIAKELISKLKPDQQRLTLVARSCGSVVAILAIEKYLKNKNKFENELTLVLLTPVLSKQTCKKIENILKNKDNDIKIFIVTSPYDTISSYDPLIATNPLQVGEANNIYGMYERWKKWEDNNIMKNKIGFIIPLLENYNEVKLIEHQLFNPGYYGNIKLIMRLISTCGDKILGNNILYKYSSVNY